MKLIVITGGVLSGLGKGVAAASLGSLLIGNQKILPIKLDGYLNSDPGTMNPIEHGEVFVLEDGGEVDMDFGHYERFLDINCTKDQNLTMGKIFYEVWKKERRGDYLGKTVQLIPHVTDLIKEKILDVGKKHNVDILLVEIGGTIGDIENELFVESIRQLKKDMKDEDIVIIHLTYVPIPFGVKEQKTKPTQQSVRILKEKGINPDFILGRCSEFLNTKTKQKIALFSDLTENEIISAPDVNNIYEIPLIFKNQGLGKKVAERLKIEYKEGENIKKIERLLCKKRPSKIINIAIAGKYTELEDSYASIVEAIHHCDLNFNVKTKLNWIETSKNLEDIDVTKFDGVIVPGGFGNRGVEGKIRVIKKCREKNIPFLGICYGMQLAVVEFARNVCGLKDANTTEVDPITKNPVVKILDEQKNIKNKGGTMRLGSYEAYLEDSKIKEYYKKTNNYKIKDSKFVVSERHRHRFEVNPSYHKILEKKGLIIVGKGKTGLAEFIELSNHKYFVATQGHPELKSKPYNVAPLFYGLYDSILK